jgi:hypothetical protein
MYAIALMALTCFSPNPTRVRVLPHRFFRQSSAICSPDIKTLEKWHMLETIAIILLVLWVLGLVSSYSMGGFIHILLVIAVVAILIRVIRGRRL